MRKRITLFLFSFSSVWFSSVSLEPGLATQLIKVGNGVDPVSSEYHVTCTHVSCLIVVCVCAVSIDLPRVVAVLQEADALFKAFKEEPRKVMIV